MLLHQDRRLDPHKPRTGFSGQTLYDIKNYDSTNK